MTEDESKPSLQALIDAVQKLWRLFHPPAFAVLAWTALVSLLVGPFGIIASGLGLQLIVSDRVLARLDSIGLKPLLPALALAVLLLGLQVARQLVESLGDLLPPFIIMRSANLLQPFLGEEKMVNAWSNYSEADDIDAFNVTIDQELAAVGETRRVPHLVASEKWVALMEALSWWLKLFKLLLYGIPALVLIAVLKLDAPGSIVLPRGILLWLMAWAIYCFTTVRFLDAFQQNTGARVLYWYSVRERRSDDIDPQIRTGRLEQVRAMSHQHWWAIVIRSPIRTGRISLLLKERFTKSELRQITSGDMV